LRRGLFDALTSSLEIILIKFTANQFKSKVVAGDGMAPAAKVGV